MTTAAEITKQEQFIERRLGVGDYSTAIAAQIDLIAMLKGRKALRQAAKTRLRELESEAEIFGRFYRP
jgi:hypothetical protein